MNLRLRKMKVTRIMLIALCCVMLLTSCDKKVAEQTQESEEGPITNVPFTSVKITDTFWSEKLDRNREVTIPIAIQQCYTTGRVDNFKIAGGLMEGKYQTQMPFDDTDIYKLIEAASYSLQNHPDPQLEARVDTLIYYIGKAQEPDGYIYTSRTIDPKHPHPWADTTRWTAAAKGWYGSHELYDCGHLFEAAAAHYAATGNSSLLDIATKTADLLVKDFGPGKLEFGPGHQVVEMGLVKMYHATGKKEYLDLAKFFLDVRGPGGEEYSQAHKKVIDQREPVGHAVRATYMYSAMADIATLYDEKDYLTALNAIWDDLVHKKIYITGGIGSGGGNEGFDAAYKLPNMSAYCETCASVGNINWNERMFLYDGDARYIDVMERTLYNAFLSGVSLTGDRFFYPNVLESLGQHNRGAWFGTACCPPNVARTLPSVPGYVYAKGPNSIYVNLYMANTADIDLGGESVKVEQETKYPWEGQVNIKLDPATEKEFALKMRIPGWANDDVIPGDLYHYADGHEDKYSITVNGEEVDFTMDNGYAVVNKSWAKGDVVTIDFDMTPRIVEASDSVAADKGKMAIQRGPIVYAAEWPDAEGGKVLNLIFDEKQEFTSAYEADKLGGVVVVKAKAKAAKAKLEGGIEYSEEQEIELIPYYTWNNRGAGEMMVWLPVNESSVRPLPSPTIASTSKVSASRENKMLVALNDQLLPENSGDREWPYYHWWPKKGTAEWVQYDFEGTKTISSSKVYWFDDEPFGECRIPASWEMQYKTSNGDWKTIKADYPVVKDDWSAVSFDPVTATAVKLKIQLPEKFSAGIHEWIVD
ncbi:glycoside hydrolase family 127 protein [Fulvivirga maritima]|uniref:glycoside hydrolase family 127 protein n=1 Tax=Fulvivirga maritima TaxID=2904247 RepID=UPI001F476FEB|nr:beta-L-arabinofuranosidase domain-containing protein [Fulvivirga maritima]UII26179.1 glycoside hydrolase family 127 protein [Fulvivirga maritima]